MVSRFFLVDVFAERRYSGNQLAVVVSDEALAEQEMQLLAAETNYSETTFVVPRVEANSGYGVRIFTPAREIAFAGHPILGTAWVLRHFVAANSPDALLLNLAVGPVPVYFELNPQLGELTWFVAPPSILGSTVAPETLASVLGIPVSAIDSQWPVQQVSGGVSALIVPLAGLDALRRCTVNAQSFANLAALGLPSLVYFYCTETHSPENDLCARFFFEANGAREDPATGNGAAFLGAYLLQRRLVAESRGTLRIEQGYEIGRPSLVLLRARHIDGRPEVRVGGSVVVTVRGELA